jgi:HSP20 family protein
MLMRTDPLRELDRLTQQMFGTTTRPAVMPMDAWREGDKFVVEFDLPGVKPEDIDLNIERNALTVKAERPASETKDAELIAAERPRGVFSRQLFLGDNLNTERVHAEYHAGVLRLTIPVSEQAKPRKIEIDSTDEPRQITGNDQGQPGSQAQGNTATSEPMARATR